MYNVFKSTLKISKVPLKNAKKELKTWKKSIPHRKIFRRDKGAIPERFEINEEELYLFIRRKGTKV